MWKTVCFEHNVLFYILGVFWPIKILLINFCQEGPQMLHGKFGTAWSNFLGGVWKSKFFNLTQFCEWKVTVKVGVTYTTQFSPIQRARQCNVSHCATHYVWVMGQNCFWVDNSITCLSFLVRELQGPVFTTPIFFISIRVMVWAQCQVLNQSRKQWWTGPHSSRLSGHAATGVCRVDVFRARPSICLSNLE